MKLSQYIYYTRGTRSSGPNIRFMKQKPGGQYGTICIGFSVKKLGYKQALALAIEARDDHLAKFSDG